jgi:hypothetical protein
MEPGLIGPCGQPAVEIVDASGKVIWKTNVWPIPCAIAATDRGEPLDSRRWRWC